MKRDVFICRRGYCNKEYNRNPGKTAATGMRHYAAGCLCTPW